MKRRQDDEPLDARFEALLREAQDLPVETLHRLRLRCGEALDAAYARKTASITQCFFDTFLLQGVLQPLAERESLGFMCTLMPVCKQWRRLLLCVTRLNLGPSNYGGTLYGIVLRQFAHVTTLGSHRRILCNYNRHTQEFGRIRELKIHKAAQYDETRYAFDISGFTSLQKFSFGRCEQLVPGLAALTTLESLRIDASAFGDFSDDLLKLTRLHTLRISGFPHTLDLTPLAALRRLESNIASHFAHYTGEGRLAFDDGHTEDDAETALRDTYQEDCWNSVFLGRWEAGVFSGSVSCQYGEDYSDFEGTLLAHKREGEGVDKRGWEMREHRGCWRAGLQHGRFDVYSYDDRPYTPNYVLYAIDEWDHGTLLSRALVGEETV